MKRQTFLLFLFIQIFVLGLNAQKEGAPNFSIKILAEGLGKVTTGDIDNDSENDVIKIAGVKGKSIVLFKFNKLIADYDKSRFS